MHRDELVFALSAGDFSPYYKKADAIRREAVGDIVHLRAILEFSNHCKRNCAYCGLNCKNAKLTRYRMEAEEIVAVGKSAYEAGYKTLVLQSGEDPYYTKELIGQIVKELSDIGIVITLSCGERSPEEYAYWRNMGARRYLLKHETADAKLYANLHPGHSLNERIEALRAIHDCGYETGSGFMVGLPGESAESLADNIRLLSQLDCKMAGIGPFIPNPDTELGGLQAGSVETTQKAVALTRILCPEMNLPATTALGVRDTDAFAMAFSRGANVLMRKVTPEPYKSLYQIYPAKLSNKDIATEREEVCGFLKKLGKIPE